MAGKSEQTSNKVRYSMLPTTLKVNILPQLPHPPLREIGSQQGIYHVTFISFCVAEKESHKRENDN